MPPNLDRVLGLAEHPFVPTPELTFHVQRANHHGLSLQASIRSALVGDALLIVRGDRSTWTSREYELLNQSGVRFVLEESTVRFQTF